MHLWLRRTAGSDQRGADVTDKVIYAYYIGGPLDGDMVHESFLHRGPTIVVPVPDPIRAYWTLGGSDPEVKLAVTHTYREAPPMRVGDRAVFRFFVSERYGRGDALGSMVDMLVKAMQHRVWARKVNEVLT